VSDSGKSFDDLFKSCCRDDSVCFDCCVCSLALLILLLLLCTETFGIEGFEGLVVVGGGGSFILIDGGDNGFDWR
jgi:hypothetical protein